ncbi:MAG: hypothetical protein WBA77_19200 [Microcoleaceae cyanobacterium]
MSTIEERLGNSLCREATPTLENSNSTVTSFNTQDMPERDTATATLRDRILTKDYLY